MLRKFARELRPVFEASDVDDTRGVIDGLNELMERHPITPRIADHDGADLHLHVATRTATVAELLIGEALLGLATLVCDLGRDAGSGSAAPRRAPTSTSTPRPTSRVATARTGARRGPTSPPTAPARSRARRRRPRSWPRPRRPPLPDLADLGRTRLREAGCVYAEEEAALLSSAASSPAELERLVARRVAGVPLEHVLGWASFCGLQVHVDEGVFVPRARTELLVDLAVGSVRVGRRSWTCAAGRGRWRPRWRRCRRPRSTPRTSTRPSVACARRNLPPERVFEGDLYDALPDHLRGRVDVLVANAPYVPTDAIATMPPEAREHEPLVALDGGPDGVDLHRRIAAGAGDWLAPGGHLVIETGRSPGRRSPSRPVRPPGSRPGWSPTTTWRRPRSSPPPP